MWHSFHVILIRVWAAVITHNHCRKFEKGSLRTLSIGSNHCCPIFDGHPNSVTWSGQRAPPLFGSPDNCGSKNSITCPSGHPTCQWRGWYQSQGVPSPASQPSIINHRPCAQVREPVYLLAKWSMTQYPGTFPLPTCWHINRLPSGLCTEMNAC